MLTPTPAPESAYIVHTVFVGGPTVNVAYASFSGAAPVYHVPVPLCLSEYCADIAVTSRFSDESVTSGPLCVPGSDPQIEPAADGAVLVFDNPCADGSGSDSLPSPATPSCTSYADVRWFSSEVDGLVALGLEPDAAEAQANHQGTGGTIAIGSGGGAGKGGVAAANGTTATTADAPSNYAPATCAVSSAPRSTRGGLAWAVLFGLFLGRRRVYPRSRA